MGRLLALPVAPPTLPTGEAGSANVGHSGELVLKPVGSVPTLATEARGRLLALAPVAPPTLPVGKLGAPMLATLANWF